MMKYTLIIMEQPNLWILPVAAIIPLALGFIWYNPKVFGNAWMKAAEISEERAKSGNMLKIFGLTYLFSLFAAYVLTTLSVHQASLFGLFLGDPTLEVANSEINEFLSDFMATYGDRHRSFGHGIIHGLESGLLLGLPFIGINTLFERRPMKYMWIHVGFWMLCFALMGGIICCYF